MKAELITFPAYFRFLNALDFIEQRDREIAARIRELTTSPPRCRPLLVVNNDRKKSIQVRTSLPQLVAKQTAIPHGTDSPSFCLGNAMRQDGLVPL